MFESPDLLILDEVGVQNVTEFERTVMLELINSRYEAMKPTIVISNRGKVELPTYMDACYRFNPRRHWPASKSRFW